VRLRGTEPGTSDEQVWRRFLDEVAWLYRQMDQMLRQRVAPVLSLFEIKTIVLCAHNRAAHRASEIEDLLARSLLCAPLAEALRRGPDVPATVTAITAVLAAVAPPAAEAGKAYAAHGLRGFEDGLMRGYLTHAATLPLQPAVARFVAAFIDLRNVMILYKQLHWSAPDAAAFIPGGSLAPAVFAEALTGRQETAVADVARRATGLKVLPAAASEGALETVLLSCLARELRAAARNGELVPTALDYLWRQYVAARNVAVLLHGAGLEAAVLERELIQ